MRKKYAILHIFSGSYAWIGTDRSMVDPITKFQIQQTLKRWSENPDVQNSASIYGFFAGPEFLDDYKNSVETGMRLTVPSKKQASRIIWTSEFRENIAMDIFKDAEEKPELMPWEFEIVDVTKGVE